MRSAVRLFLLAEAATFIVASLVHTGVVISGYGHRRAHVAESVIATVLLLGAAFTWIRPAWAREVGLLAQGFALLGTLVGIAMVAIGVGPRTVPDVVYHVVIALVLVCGLAVTARTQSQRTARSV
jgi:divalent metal cation (Fe/Co/Zn/Cd) transporter